MENYLNIAISFITTFGLKLLFAIIILVVGLKLTKILIHHIAKGKGFSLLDPGVQTFIQSALKIVFYVLIFMSCAGVLGIPTTSFMTVLASCGLAIGLALQGALSNFAGGIMILLFKPFKIGDYVELGANSGTVKAINVFYTVLITVDNKNVTIPNGTITNSEIVNYSAEKTRRVDMTFSVSYSSDIKKVKEILINVARDSSKALTEPAPVAYLIKQNDSTLDFVLRVWCNTADYWDLYFELNENVKLKFDEFKIEIPFPQLDVHLNNN